ncbi:hypothetical protein GBAR_LOCUS11957, partial [Geodia barretti]
GRGATSPAARPCFVGTRCVSPLCGDLIRDFASNGRSTDDGWRGPDSKRCRQSTGGATTSTERVLGTGPEAESKATRSKEHPRN